MSKKSKRPHGDGANEVATVGGYKLKPAAAYIGGLSVPTMHRLIARGLLRPNRKIRHLIFSREELERFLNT